MPKRKMLSKENLKEKYNKRGQKERFYRKDKLKLPRHREQMMKPFHQKLPFTQPHLRKFKDEVQLRKRRATLAQRWGREATEAQNLQTPTTVASSLAWGFGEACCGIIPPAVTAPAAGRISWAISQEGGLEDQTSCTSSWPHHYQLVIMLTSSRILL